MEKASQVGKEMPPYSDTLAEEARAWVGRLTSGRLTQGELLAFRYWQNTSPDHQVAFEDAKRQWHTVKPVLGTLLREDEAIARHHAALMRGNTWGFHLDRRAFLGLGVSAAGLAAVAMVHPPFDSWPSWEEWSADARTAVGEQRRLALATGVDITLNTRTSVRRHLLEANRIDLDLINGEAAIDVSSGQRVTVLAGAGRSYIEAGNIEVRHLDGQVCVTCVAGDVTVEHPGGVRYLQARQQVRYDNSGMGEIVGVELSRVSAWREGMLVFDKTPLADVIAEINRYRQGRIFLQGEKINHHLVSGRFHIGVLDEAVLQLQKTFNLKARSFPARVLVLS